jgi:hypothetical protein
MNELLIVAVLRLANVGFFFFLLLANQSLPTPFCELVHFCNASPQLVRLLMGQVTFESWRSFLDCSQGASVLRRCNR